MSKTVANDKGRKTDARPEGTEKRAHVVVFGNEKGGSGKSTSAMHAAIALLRLGYRVGTIDLDARQGTLSRYFKNRWDYIERTRRRDLPSPPHMAIPRSEADERKSQEEEDFLFLMMALEELGPSCDFIVIDTPGSDCFLSRLAHAHADTIVTPVNDSFVDLDVIGRVDMDTMDLRGPSVYTRMVKEQTAARMERTGLPCRWLVMRNRLGHLNAKNKNDVGRLLEKMSAEFGFVLAPGFGERVVFRELFLKGLTLLDLKEDPDHIMTYSHLAARQEVRGLILAIGPDIIKGPMPKPAYLKSDKTANMKRVS